MKYALIALAGCGRIGFGDVSLGDARVPLDVATAPESGLVAWWTLDEGTGANVYDSSGNHLHGWTDSCGSPYATWTAGRFGSGLRLDPANGNCISTDELSLLEIAGDWTVSAWVNPASLPAANDAFAIVVKPNSASKHNYALFLDHGFIGASNLGWTVDFDGASDARYTSAVTDSVTTGTWYFVAGTWDGTRLTLFVNGAAADAVMPAEPPDASVYGGGSPTLVGKNTCCTQYLDGAVDDVRIYSRALDSSELAALYTRP